MTFVNIKTIEGSEALRRALEAPSVLRVSDGTLKVDDVLGMTEAETVAAFRLIRWPDTKGMPSCPQCQATEHYWYAARRCWSCKQCRHQFTETSGTVLSHRKLPLRNYLFSLSLVLDISQILSLRHDNLTRPLEGYKTTLVRIHKLRECAGPNGCTVPVAILSRTAWLLKREALRGSLGRLYFARAPRSTPTETRSEPRPFYPYVRGTDAPNEGAELVEFADALVPRGLPDYVRADICQDMIVAILLGEATRGQVAAAPRKFISQVVAESPWKYKWISLDAPLDNQEPNGRTLHDVIAASEDYYEACLSG